jgi:hypothetical protein
MKLIKYNILILILFSPLVSSNGNSECDYDRSTKYSEKRLKCETTLYKKADELKQLKLYKDVYFGSRSLQEYVPELPNARVFIESDLVSEDREYFEGKYGEWGKDYFILDIKWEDGNEDKIIAGVYFPPSITSGTKNKFILILRKEGKEYKRKFLYVINADFITLSKGRENTIRVNICYECDGGYVLEYNQGNYKLIYWDCCPGIDESGKPLEPYPEKEIPPFIIEGNK